MPARLEVRVRGDQCAGAPRMTVTAGGRELIATEVRTSTWTTRQAATVLPAGTHRVAISFTNDYRSSACDRNVPGRDCGSHSAGGAGSPEAYRGFAEGIGAAPAVVVLAGGSDPSSIASP